MASGSGGSNAFTWFVIGVLTGVAGTLAVLIWSGRHHARQEQPPIESAAPAVVYRPPIAAPAAKPAPPASAAPAAETAPVSSTVDSQVAEDAAAAGMTSRSRSPSPPPQ